MTIKDIAKLADVSVSTVSRVLNDRPQAGPRRHRGAPVCAEQQRP